MHYIKKQKEYISVCVTRGYIYQILVYFELYKRKICKSFQKLIFALVHNFQ